MDSGEERIIYNVSKSYRLIKQFGATAGDLIDSGNLSEQEFKRVMWDAKNIGNDSARSVHVHGEYECRSKE